MSRSAWFALHPRECAQGALDLVHYRPEQLLVGRQHLGLGQRLGHSRLVDQVAPGYVVIDAVTPPGTTAQGECLAHAIPEIAAI